MFSKNLDRNFYHRCLFVTFTLGFALLSSWVSNVADIIYTRHFDPTLEQDIERKLSMDQVVNPEAERHLRMQASKIFPLQR